LQKNGEHPEAVKELLIYFIVALKRNGTPDFKTGTYERQIQSLLVKSRLPMGAARCASLRW
jgi:hypothetical protein